MTEGAEAAGEAEKAEELRGLGRGEGAEGAKGNERAEGVVWVPGCARGARTGTASPPGPGSKPLHPLLHGHGFPVRLFAFS